MANRGGEFKAGHKKISPLETVVPAPSGGNFIPATQRGPRPELPHKTNEGAYGDYAPIKLTPQQEAENNHIKVQQDNWDAHHALEQESKPKTVSSTVNSDFNVDEMEPEARARYERDAAEMGGQESGGATGFASLKAIHGELSSHLETLRSHLGIQHDVAREARRAAVDSYNKAQELGLKHKALTNAGKVPPPAEVEDLQLHKETSSNLASFPQRHFRAMNRHATAEGLLTKAKSLMDAGRTADATDLIGKAHSEISSMAKHLKSPITQVAYEKAGVYAPVPNVQDLQGIKGALKSNINAEGGGIGRKRGPQGDAPTIRIGKPGRLKGDKGSLEDVVADEAGLQRVKEKYGTQHPYYKKVKQAHYNWKRGPAGNKSVREIALRPIEEDRDNAAVLEAMRGGRAFEGEFKSEEAKKAEFVGHATAVRDAIVAGKPIPSESADHIGLDNVKKLIARHTKGN